MTRNNFFIHALRCSCIVMLLLWGQVAQAGEAPWYNGRWAHEESDLAPDPSILFGQLENGFRYAVIPHDFPRGRVSMMLNVQAGSLMEEDDELGYAHFVEHMAFNGSKNFKSGELIPFFQQHGMSFGGDTNAHTSFTETVYKLNLADNTAESIGMGAKVLRDFADGILFSENEVKSELGIILSEMRSRENESTRASRKKREIIFAGTRFVNEIIGTDETLKAVSGSKLRAFYDRWYRPERMMLVVVGDVDVAEMATVAKNYFSDIVARDKNIPVVPAWGEARAFGLRAVYQEREHDAVTVSLQTLHKRHFVPDSKARLYASLTDSLAEFCMQQRLDRLREEQPDVWVQGIFQNWRQDPMFPLTVMTAVTTQKDWEKSLVALSDELRSALQFGFTETEMQLALKQFEISLQGAAQARKRMPNDTLSLAFISATNEGKVFTSEEYDLALFSDFAKHVTVDDINKAFGQSFQPDNMTVYVTGPEKFLTDNIILQAYTKAQERPVAEKYFAGVGEFPYLPLPGPLDKLPPLSEEKLTHTNEEGGPRLFSTILPNGVEIRLLHYPVEKGRVQAKLFFGHGNRIYEDNYFPTLEMLNATLGVTGVGKLDSQESLLLFGYRDMVVQEFLASNTSVIGGSGRSEDLELLLQAVWTQYKDPVISPKDRMLVVRNIELQQRIKEETVDGVSQSRGRGFFYGDALRFTDVSAHMANAVSLGDMQKVLNDTRQTPPVKILIGGDFDVEKSLQIVARLFGSDSFPQERHMLPFKASPPEFPREAETELAVSQDPVAKSILRLAIRNDIAETDRRALAERNLVAALLSDHLREELRERLGIIYGASVWYNLLSDTLNEPGYGLFTIALVTGHTHIDQVKEVVHNAMQSFSEKPVSPETLDRIRKPMITRWKTDRNTLDKWCRLQQGEMLKGYPYGQWDNEYETLLDSITPEELMATAKELFKKGIDGSLHIYSTGVEHK